MTERIHTTPRPEEAVQLSTEALRAAFLLGDLFQKDRLSLTFTNLDRLAVGGASPETGPVALEPDRRTGTGFFLERREMGIINTGGAGSVTADGTRHDLQTLDGLYLGMGARSVSFASADGKNPARFYILSCPAHHAYPSVKIARETAKAIPLGGQPGANRRNLYQYIHPAGVRSCQLVMGFTEVEEGSVWNTMPPHTHGRRSEIYFYFDLGANAVVHLMGEPHSTRHLIVRDRQAVLSPPWSTHFGCGTGHYRFVWGMAGENQVFEDMDGIAVAELR